MNDSKLFNLPPDTSKAEFAIIQFSICSILHTLSLSAYFGTKSECWFSRF
jgi:hypothetical protein